MTEQIEAPRNIFEEVGTPGLEAFSGFVQEAYLPELRWPAVYPLYNRYRRADPETVIARQVFTTMARGVRFEFSLAEDATPDEKAFAEFGDQVLDDIEGGQSAFIETVMENVPFFGWGWWEVLPGIQAFYAPPSS